jgi:BON domain
MKTDTEIKRDVEAELRWDPEIDDTDIAVKTTNAVVTLKPLRAGRTVSGAASQPAGASFLRRFDSHAQPSRPMPSVSHTHTPCGGEYGYP